MMSVKEELYKECSLFINNRLQTVQKIVKNIQESLQSETKSSAGDKHETGRAMLQLEREKAGNQMTEINKLKQLLVKVDVQKTSDIICLGSLVYTNKGVYFLAISKGVVIVDTVQYFVVGPHSPIGKLLLGKRKGDSFAFNNNNFEIQAVV